MQHTPHPYDVWYKNPIFMLFMLIMALTFIVSGVLIYNGIRTSDSVVQDNWYLEGKALDNDLSLDSTASMYKVTATMLATDTGLNVSITSSSPLPPSNNPLNLNLYHATLATRDQQFTLKQNGINSYSVANFNAKLIQPGNYIVELTNGSWRLRGKNLLPNPKIDLHYLPLSRTVYTP